MATTEKIVEFIVGIISFLCFVYVLYSAWTSAAPTGTKLIWTILALIPGLNILTAIAYYFLGPKSVRA